MELKITFNNGFLIKTENYVGVTKFELVDGSYLFEDIGGYHYKISQEELESFSILK